VCAGSDRARKATCALKNKREKRERERESKRERASLSLWALWRGVSLWLRDAAGDHFLSFAQTRTFRLSSHAFSPITCLSHTPLTLNLSLTAVCVCLLFASQVMGGIQQSNINSGACEYTVESVDYDPAEYYQKVTATF